MNDIIITILGVMIGVVLIGYIMLPVVTDVIASVTDSSYATLLGVAVTVTILTLAIFPILRLVRDRRRNTKGGIQDVQNRHY